MKNPAADTRRLVSDLCSGYAQVYFSTRWYTGALFLAATFIVPAHGLAGLTGLALSNLAAVLLGMPRDQIRRGYFAYNGLLVGLALGLTYKVNGALMLMLVVISFLGVFIASAIRALFERYVGTPPLSAPFVITTWVALSAGERFSDLVFTLKPFQASMIAGLLPGPVELFVRSLGAAFFQLSVPSGIVVALGLLLFSRHAFLLAVAGLASGSLVHLILGGRPEDLQTGLVGFNFMLTAIALGGVWAVPGPASFVLAMLGAALCSVIAAAAAVVLKPLGLPLLAFPFVATTTIVLFAMRHRERLDRIQLVTIPAQSPEANVKITNSFRARKLGYGLPAFELPFNGEWTVTQGFFGEYTHRDLWAHAWDFEVISAEGKTFNGDGTKTRDYLTYKVPVLAPADGKVVRVVDHIPDNPVGQINGQSNWGNLVIIWHYGSVYTALCHLAKGEVAVREGAQVRAGEVIARAGSSGRSPVPHLHFQVQYSPEIGSPTADAEILHYVVQEEGPGRYVTRGAPEKNQSIKRLETDPARFQAVSFPIGKAWRFLVREGAGEREEVWESEVDLYGNRYLSCKKTGARASFYLDSRALILLDYDGPGGTALSWFYLALPRLPLTSMNVRWEDRLPPDLLLTRGRKTAFDLFEPFTALAGLETRSRFLSSQGGAFSVQTRIKPVGPLLSARRELTFVSGFDYRRGLLSLNVMEQGQTILHMQQLDDHSGVKGKLDATAAGQVTAAPINPVTTGDFTAIEPGLGPRCHELAPLQGARAWSGYSGASPKTDGPAGPTDPESMFLGRHEDQLLRRSRLQ